MSENGAPKTLSDKLWERHLIHAAPNEQDLLYIDLHLVHEVTSPQAFDGLRMANRDVRRPDLTVATADHNVPTIHIERPIADPISSALTLQQGSREPCFVQISAFTDFAEHTVHAVFFTVTVDPFELRTIEVLVPFHKQLEGVPLIETSFSIFVDFHLLTPA